MAIIHGGCPVRDFLDPLPKYGEHIGPGELVDGAAKEAKPVPWVFLPTEEVGVNEQGAGVLKARSAPSWRTSSGEDGPRSAMPTYQSFSFKRLPDDAGRGEKALGAQRDK